jgi:hypothetical protein
MQKIDQMSAAYDQLVQTLRAMEDGWLQSLLPNTGRYDIEAQRQPFVPPPMPDELW